MTDPAGSDLPTASGTGFDDVPLTREDAVERESAPDDDQPATSDVGLLDRADPDGSA